MKSDIVKTAFFRSFYAELDRIEEDRELKKMAGAFFAKHAKALTSKTRKNLSEGAFVFPKERRYPIHDESHARNALARASGKAEEGRVRAAVHARYPNIGKEKKAMGMPDIPSWVAPVARHTAYGALPGAAIGAATAKKGERKKGALKGAAIGGTLTFAGGNMVNRIKRNVDVANRASKKIGFNMDDFVSQDAKTREKFHRLSHIYRKNTPIYKTAAHEDWEKEEKKESFLKKHKGKIIGGLALATAAGVGGKLLRTKLKGKKPVTPPTAAARRAAAPPPPPPASKVRPTKEQGSTHRGTTIDIPGMKRGKGQRTTLADLQAEMNERKAAGRTKHRNDHKKPPAGGYPDDYDGDEAERAGRSK